MKKESWDNSTEKAKSLKIENFGTEDEVIEMAKPIRTATNRQEAMEILKEITTNKSLTNKNGLIVTLSSDSRGKIVSSKALNTSYTQKVHFLAVANIDKLFYNSIEPWEFEFNPYKSNDELKARRYLYAPLEYDNMIFPVKITVKEFKDQNLGNRLYSIEVIDIEIKNKGVGMLAPDKPEGMSSNPSKTPLPKVAPGEFNINYYTFIVKINFKHLGFFVIKAKGKH